MPVQAETLQAPMVSGEGSGAGWRQELPNIALLLQLGGHAPAPLTGYVVLRCSERKALSFYIWFSH